jgi:hypothetical protein
VCGFFPRYNNQEVTVKRLITALIAAMLVFALFAGCASKPDSKPFSPPESTVKSYPPQILMHKGTAFGIPYPNWMEAALQGPKYVEKLADFKNKYIVIVEQDGKDLEGTRLAASRMDAQTTISALISTRVKDTFAGAQVGDKDKIETYMERCVKSVSQATFSGFAMESEWWVQLQTFTPDGKPDKQVYRVIQVWGIDRDLLQKQIDKILKDNAASEPKTPEKQRAMDLVQQSFFDGF